MKTIITPKCYAFAKYLFETTTADALNGNHQARDADPGDLKRWKISRQEWSLAHSAASEAKKTGRPPGEFLKSAQTVFDQMVNNRTIDASGTEVFGLDLDVGGSERR